MQREIYLAGLPKLALEVKNFDKDDSVDSKLLTYGVARLETSLVI